jgi:hypothetical protein
VGSVGRGVPPVGGPIAGRELALDRRLALEMVQAAFAVAPDAGSN